MVTLGTLSIGRSLAVVLSQNKMIYDFGPDADTIFAIGGGQILGIANPVWVLLILTVVFSGGAASDALGPASVRDRRQ